MGKVVHKYTRQPMDPMVSLFRLIQEAARIHEFSSSFRCFSFVVTRKLCGYIKMHPLVVIRLMAEIRLTS